MIIKNITIENFQSYFGKQTLEFSEGLNLIVGKGGKGKSKLFNAFYWVLFGKIYITGIGWCRTDALPHSAKMSMKRHEFINKRALSLAAKGERVKASVQIEIENDKGVTYFIERWVEALRNEGEDWNLDTAWNVVPNALKVSFDSANGTIVKTDEVAEDKINELFPDGIRNYIWFQGESLENLINFRDRETLKSAVKHMSYFPFYEKLSDIISRSKEKIERLESSSRRTANKHNNAVAAIVATIENLNRKIKQEERNAEKVQLEIDTISVALASDESKMTGLASFTSLVSKYKSCENEIAALNSRIFGIDEYQRKKLNELWVLRGISPMLEKCKAIIESHTEEELTVPEAKYIDNPSRSKLLEIIKDGKCFVCGSAVEEGNEAHHYILERIRLQDEYYKAMEDYRDNMQINKQLNMFVGSIMDNPEELMRAIGQIDKQYDDTESELERLMALRKKKNEEKKELDIQIEEIKRKHGVDPVHQAETANIVGTNIRASRSNLERKRQQLQIIQTTIAGYKRDLQKAEKEYEALGKKDTSVVSVPETEWKNISIFLEDICKRVQENARKELLRKIEERANIFYAKFTEHDNGYKGTVSIGDDYSIEFDAGLNTSHEDRKKMSIINALLSLNQEALGIYYPFISDAPTSSFDIDTTYKYLLGVKDIFGQSIIMTKDVDLSNEKYKDLLFQSKVGKIYVLESEIHTEAREPELDEVSTRVVAINKSSL